MTEISLHAETENEAKLRLVLRDYQEEGRKGNRDHLQIVSLELSSRGMEGPRRLWQTGWRFNEGFLPWTHASGALFSEPGGDVVWIFIVYWDCTSVLAHAYLYMLDSSKSEVSEPLEAVYTSWIPPDGLPKPVAASERVVTPRAGCVNALKVEGRGAILELTIGMEGQASVRYEFDRERRQFLDRK